MSVLRGWRIGEQHLATEALAAYVDEELSASARERAAAHLTDCASCASEERAQRQARIAVRSAETPTVSTDLMDTLRSIPIHAPLPQSADELAVNDDGELVTVSRSSPSNSSERSDSTKNTAHASSSSTRSSRLGSSQPLGENALGDDRFLRRTRGSGSRYGASAVVSGLVLGALTFMAPGSPSEDREHVPAASRPDGQTARPSQVAPAALYPAVNPPSHRPAPAEAPRLAQPER